MKRAERKLRPRPMFAQQQLLPPQQESRSRIQIRELQLLPPANPIPFPHPLSHPHPQFVAAKSLIFQILRIGFTMYHMRQRKNGDRDFRNRSGIRKCRRDPAYRIPIPGWDSRERDPAPRPGTAGFSVPYLTEAFHRSFLFPTGPEGQPLLP